MTARTAHLPGIDGALRAASAALLLLAWQALSALDGSLLPGPLAVMQVLVAETLHGPLLWHIGMTLWRVLAAVSIAMVAGGALGIAMGRLPLIDAVAAPWVKTFLNLPALVVMVLVYVLLGLNDVAAVLAVAIDKIPLAAVTLRDGARALEPRYEEVARIYRFGPVRQLRHVMLPQLAPYVMIALRNGLAVVWKLMLVAEFLGRPDGVGFVIQSSFQLFDVTRLMAYALAFLACVLLIDRAVLQPLERRFGAWRAE